MDDKIDKQHIKTLLEKICAYEQFAKSPKYTHLITFLVEQALAGNNLKEHIIGLELFEQNYNADKNDGIVRVYMYNLRKKLKAYYEHEGKHDSLIFGFEKGSYNLKFIAHTAENSEGKSKREKVKKLPSFVLGVVLISALIILAYRGFHRPELYCWKDFLSKGATNTCILADQVILYDTGEQPGTLLTRPEVNSASDFIDYQQAHPEDSLLMAGYTFFSKAIPFALLDIAELTYKFNAHFQPLPESKFRYEISKQSNIIYIGQYKTMSLSKELFLKNSQIFQANNNYFFSVKNGERTHYRPVFDNEIRTEYAMVSFMPLSGGKKALYFVSNHDIGTMATVAQFTKLDFLSEFYKQLPSSQSYFNALFKVEGLERTDVSCELVELEVVEP